MSLNLHHLRVFARVAEEGGFTRAAESLRLSQPAVSKAVRELERQTGVPLIERAGRATKLVRATGRLSDLGGGSGRVWMEADGAVSDAAARGRS